MEYNLVSKIECSTLNRARAHARTQRHTHTFSNVCIYAFIMYTPTRLGPVLSSYNIHVLVQYAK